jgi:hypothetical protein
MHGKGAEFLRHSFEILSRQTFTDFDVVISDHSADSAIEHLCQEFRDRLEIHYLKNTDKRGNSSANLNNAIRHATGTLIKILFQDDFLFDEHALEETVRNFDLEKDTWLVSACKHSTDGKNFTQPYYPTYNHKIHLGKNTISSPSVLTIKNNSPLLFDENLLWLMDCDYYRRLYDVFGSPKILNTVTVVNRTGAHQVTNVLATRSVRARERTYMIKKFGKGPGPVSLPQVTLVAVSSVQITETVAALKKSMRGIVYKHALLLTDASIDLASEGIEVQKIENLDYNGYSHFMIYKLKDFIQTDFALIVQHDGYVLRPHKWRPEFLTYDYIGAPWKKGLYYTEDGTEVRVGNGGFSLRSKKLLEAPTKLKIPFTDHHTGFFHEDGIICLFYRTLLERHGIRFAPVLLASQFSRERFLSDSAWLPFGFHSNRRHLFSYIWKKIKHYL